jgi:hypothetical protein
MSSLPDAPLAWRTVSAHAPLMFTVSESDAEAIRRAYEDGGELSAAVELRRLFPGIADNENARRCARTIASWTPLPPLPPKKARRCATNS